MTDVEKIVEKASKQITVDELRAGGVSRVNVITRGQLNKIIREEVEKITKNLKESEKAEVVSSVAKRVGDNETALSAKLDELRAMVLELVNSGKINSWEAKSFIDKADVSLTGLMKDIQIESNVEDGVQKMEGAL